MLDFVLYITKVQLNTILVARYAKKHQICQNLKLRRKDSRFGGKKAFGHVLVTCYVSEK